MFSKGTYKLQIVLGLRTWNESIIKYQSFLLHFFCSLLLLCLFSLGLVISFVSHEILIIFLGAKSFCIIRASGHPKISSYFTSLSPLLHSFE